jgi:hypothetical protein
MNTIGNNHTQAPLSGAHTKTNYIIIYLSIIIIIYLYTGRGGPPHAHAKCKSSGPGCTSQGRGMYNRDGSKQIFD